MPEKPPDQVWTLVDAAGTHRVEVRGSWSKRVRWRLDDHLVAETRSLDDHVRLSAKDRADQGVVSVRFSRLGTPRRATLFRSEGPDPQDDSTRALVGVGGVDLLPSAGSPADRHEQRVRADPGRYALVAALGGVATVVVPIVLATLLARLAFTVPWPDWDLPGIPWPSWHLPRIPWPDWHLPSIPWPDWHLPGWLSWLLSHARYVWPVLLAYGVARADIRRRRRQDELRGGDAGRTDNPPGPEPEPEP